MQPRKISRSHRCSEKGITLIEVLVSILILGTVIASLLSLLTVHTANITSLQQNVLARIVAENAMVEVVTNHKAGRRSSGVGDVALAGQNFYWEVLLSPSPYEGLDTITLIVKEGEDEDDRVLTEIRTLLSQEGGR
ncbi:MAG: type II secretion system minor pseudopilin GspI [Pseudomonadota bacterium]